MLHLRRIVRMLSLISGLKKPKKLKVLVWQAKFESGIIFWGELNVSWVNHFVNSDYIPSQKAQKNQQNHITLVWHTPLVMVAIWGVLPLGNTYSCSIRAGAMYANLQLRSFSVSVVQRRRDLETWSTPDLGNRWRALSAHSYDVVQVNMWL